MDRPFPLGRGDHGPARAEPQPRYESPLNLHFGSGPLKGELTCRDMSREAIPAWCFWKPRSAVKPVKQHRESQSTQVRKALNPPSRQQGGVLHGQKQQRTLEDANEITQRLRLQSGSRRQRRDVLDLVRSMDCCWRETTRPHHVVHHELQVRAGTILLNWPRLRRPFQAAYPRVQGAQKLLAPWPIEAHPSDCRLPLNERSDPLHEGPLIVVNCSPLGLITEYLHGGRLRFLEADLRDIELQEEVTKGIHVVVLVHPMLRQSGGEGPHVRQLLQTGLARCHVGCVVASTLPSFNWRVRSNNCRANVGLNLENPQRATPKRRSARATSVCNPCRDWEAETLVQVAKALAESVNRSTCMPGLPRSQSHTQAMALNSARTTVCSPECSPGPLLGKRGPARREASEARRHTTRLCQ